MQKLKYYLLSSLILVSVLPLFAADSQEQFTTSQIENLKTGIKSENNGLMRSSIYFAGKYRLTETTDALLEVLDRESEPSNIILIALAIYRIGDRDAMMKIIETANSSANYKVKHILSAIAMEYMVEKGVSYDFIDLFNDNL